MKVYERKKKWKSDSKNLFDSGLGLTANQD
jgi:hypothetical protein